MINRLEAMSMREFCLAAFVVLALFGYGLYTTIVDPQVAELAGASLRLGAQEELLNLKRISAARSVEDEEKAALLREELGELRSAYMPSVEAAALLASLSQLAAASGCRLLQVDFESEEWLQPPAGAKASQDLFKRTVVSLSLRGRYDGFIDLLKTLEDRSGRVHVGHLNMEIVTADSPDLNATCVLTVYSRESHPGEGT